MSQVQLLPAEHFSPSVFLSNSRPATNSIAIAERFGKQHKDVLKSIRNLCAELPEDVRERNFALTFRTVAGPNNSERQEEFFTVYFDGFILLVMGYTGKQALQIKLVYIAKFNEMKEQLDKLAMEERVRAAADDTALPGTAITPVQQAHLKAIADAKIGMIAPELQRKAYGELWSRFTRHFRIARYAQLPPAKMGEAVEYLVGLEIKAIKILPPAPEQKALPEPHNDRFAAYLAEVEAFRAKTEQEMDRLIYDGMKLVNYFKVGPVMHSACLRLLSDWLRKTVVSARSLPELEATSGGGGLIGLLRELDTRISMDQSIRAWANEI